MHHDRTLTNTAGPTFSNFLTWAKETGEARDTLLEIRKVATRLELMDDELDVSGVLGPPGLSLTA